MEIRKRSVAHDIDSLVNLYDSSMLIEFRYSEFDQLRYRLVQTFPHSEVPELPPKSVICEFQDCGHVCLKASDMTSQQDSAHDSLTSARRVSPIS